MTHLPLSCPQCHKPLIYVPRDGLTLHYRCVDHGAIILRPLVVVGLDDDNAPPVGRDHHQLSTFDAA
jgi:hypothetical protein